MSNLAKLLIDATKKGLVVPCFQETYEKFEHIRPFSQIMPGSFEEVAYILREAEKDEVLRGLAKTESRTFVTGLDPLHTLHLGKDGFYVSFLNPEERETKNIEVGIKKVLKAEVVKSSYDGGVLNSESLQGGILDYIRFAPWRDTFSRTKQ
ncbi:MAG: hypothetical protein AABX10_00460 [Nanoarchaeota archaeon]